VGTRVRVANTDGSSHVEEIVEWEPDRRLQLRMHRFSKPLGWLATEFRESWDFRPAGAGTLVLRGFEMHPRSIWTWPALKAVSFLVRRAIQRHLRQMAGER
jgi:hypothetical protein